MKSKRVLSEICSSGQIIVFLLFAQAAISQKDGDVKLVNGPTSYKGTVAVFYQGAWGTICDDSWSSYDAGVICRQLGHAGVDRFWYRAHYGEGPGRILIDQIRCPTEADHILQCTPYMKDWGNHDCTHKEDAGVDCKRRTPSVKPSTMPVRLVCPDNVREGSCKNCSKKIATLPGDCSNQSAVEGVVFAFYKGAWNAVSGDNFGEEEAKVVCGELGFSQSFPNPTLESLWSDWDESYCGKDNDNGSGLVTPIVCSSDEISSNDAFRKRINSSLLADLECVGNERRLLDCYFSEFGPSPSKYASRPAMVKCGFKPHPSCNVPREVYRLRGGVFPWMGRVEVRSGSSAWATVCRTGWDFAEANIVCRALGYGKAKLPYASHGRGVGSILYSSLGCTGEEDTLAECKDKTLNSVTGRCEHWMDAGVECSVPEVCSSEEEDVMTKLISRRTLQYPYQVNEFVSVKGPEGWGYVCFDSLNARSANVVCRSTKKQFGTRTRAVVFPQGKHVLYNGTFNCTGSETTLRDCNIALQETDKCKNYDKYVAVVDCSSGLPDLVPDISTLYSSLYSYPYTTALPLYYLDCAMEENCLSSSAYAPDVRRSSYRYLLRFSSLTMNWGNVDFQPSLGRDQWQYHTCHRHYHSFETFIHYDLLNATGHKAAEGHKASFCLEDSVCHGGRARYRCSHSQGISPNCGDLYASNLDCQWIDITDVPSGSYVLRLQVNPEFLIGESDYDNNEAYCKMDIVDYGYYRHVNTKTCWVSDH